MRFLDRNYGLSTQRALENGAAEARHVLDNLGLMKGDELTLSGLLLFAVNPQRFRPVDVAKCVHFTGNEVSDRNYIDSQDFEGNIQNLHKGVMAFLERNLRHEQAGQGFNSIGIPVVPMEALEEYVVNMFLHRDYFVQSPWRVFIFSDRIELISPGSLPDGLTIEQMRSGVSVPRNARLFSFAVKDGVPYRGIGSGVSRAVKLYSNVEFVNDPAGFFFKTVIWLRMKETTPQSTPQTTPQTTPQSSLSGRILAEISKDPLLSARVLSERLGIGLDTTREYLGKLKKDRRIQHVGPDFGGHWEILEH